MLIVRSHTSLDNSKVTEERTENSGETIKQVFSQTSMDMARRTQRNIKTI